MVRVCACKEDNFETKKSILEKLRSTRIVDDGNTIMIGVVFHINFQGYDKTKVEADVDYSIDLLNKDFNKQCSNFNIGLDKYTNPDLKQTYENYVALASECNIKFYKVTIKYMPLPRQTSSNLSVLDTSIKGSSPPVNPAQYLNIWVADISGGLLGYAQFPWENSPSTDGVVITKATFGSTPTSTEYGLNKTMTHEVGHWLGLYHTFQETFNYEGGNIDYQDGSPEEEIQEKKGDCVADTPPQGTPTYGNPLSNTSTWPTSKPFDENASYRHMYMNFMDYSDDIALFMFTQDQVLKIRQMIHIYRPGILQNTGEVSEPEPIYSFKGAGYNFDTAEYGWVEPMKIINNSLFLSNASITTISPRSGTRCFRCRNNSQGEFKLNLTGCAKATLNLFARSLNSFTFIWVRQPGVTSWTPIKLSYSKTYRQYTYVLPKPYDSIDATHYLIRIGTGGNSSIYSYFDDITVSNN